jgi:aromatic-L-amino-acid/L-tryptophan decarboxylase
MISDKPTPDEPTLDPKDWTALRILGHRMVDDMIDFLATVRDRPVWQPMPAAHRAALRRKLPRMPQDAASVYEAFRRLVQPYPTGNVHPRFMGWVHGGGNAVGMLAELLAGGLNANLGGRDHAPIEIERLVIRWAAEIVGLPETAAGLLVTGTSMANLIAVLVARRAALGQTVREQGLNGAPLTAYASSAAHGCIPRAMDMAGLGTSALRLVAADANGRMDLAALQATIAHDRQSGHRPFLVIGTAGTVNTGAIDDLAGIARLCVPLSLWFHVDGAFGAMAMLAPRLRPLLAGIEAADSLAFDFHKWGQVPYDAGCILVRDAARALETFATNDSYLQRADRGLAAGHPWPCDLGPDLSRGFRALKVWMTLMTYGADQIGATIEHSCDLARHLASRIDRAPDLERLAPVCLNIVCFRFIASTGDLNRLNADIVTDLQEPGVAAPSTTTLSGVLAIRAAIVNHRTRREDVDVLVDAVLTAGAKRARTSR